MSKKTFIIIIKHRLRKELKAAVDHAAVTTPLKLWPKLNCSCRTSVENGIRNIK